jgi:hypothetical protein
MIEFTRFLLSMIVLEDHIWPLRVSWLAWQSVFAFYTLSGFLMTRVLHDRYGFTLRGMSRFALNRVLRLWPAYLIVLAITAVALAFPGMGQVYPLLHFPRDVLDAIANIAVIGLVSFDFRHMVEMTLMVPTAWSLSIELFSYLLLAIYFARSPARLVGLAAIGLIGIGLSNAECAFGGQSEQYGQLLPEPIRRSAGGIHSLCDRRFAAVLRAGAAPGDQSVHLADRRRIGGDHAVHRLPEAPAIHHRPLRRQLCDRNPDHLLSVARHSHKGGGFFRPRFIPPVYRPLGHRRRSRASDLVAAGQLPAIRRDPPSFALAELPSCSHGTPLRTLAQDDRANSRCFGARRPARRCWVRSAYSAGGLKSVRGAGNGRRAYATRRPAAG